MPRIVSPLWRPVIGVVLSIEPGVAQTAYGVFSDLVNLRTGR